MMSTTVRPSHRLATLFRRKGGGGPAYLLRDEFGTAAGAPLASPRTCEPGPGTLTLVQNDGQFSISGGKLNFPAQATPANGDLGFYDGALARVAGRTLLLDTNESNFAAGNSNGLFFGFANATTLLNATIVEGAEIYRDSKLYLSVGGGFGTAAETLSAGTTYGHATVLRSAGSFQLLRVGSTWTLAWVSATGSDASLRPVLANWDAAGTLDSFRVTDLPAPWNSDYGISVAHFAGVVSAGQSYTHPQDCLLDFTVTTKPSAGSIVLIFRQQDANNYWSVEINSAGDLLLKETVAGTPTTRSTAAGVISNGHRCVIIPDDVVIRHYSNNILRTTYSSASNFKTATAGSLSSLGTGGAVSDLTVWPRYPSFPSV